MLSKLQKNWFAISATKMGDQLLILVPKSTKCTLPFSKTIRKNLLSMFEMLQQHPFIYPITDLDFLVRDGC